MDIVGGLATVGGVLALANQILQGVVTLRNFADSFTNAPAEITEISETLAILISILENIRQNRPKQGSASTVVALNQCKNIIDKLIAIANELQPGFASTRSYKRAWTASKTVIKEAKIKEFRQKLEIAKSTLSLALQVQACDIQQADHDVLSSSIANLGQTLHRERDFMQQQMEQMANLVSTLQLKYPSTPPGVNINSIHGKLADRFEDIQRAIEDLCPILSPAIVSKLARDIIRACENTNTHEARSISSSADFLTIAKTSPEKPVCRRRRRRKLCRSSFQQLITPFGTFICRHDKYSQGDLSKPSHNESFETCLKLIPSWWLRRCGLSLQVDMCIQKLAHGNWTLNLKTYHRVPGDALIFQFCESGNLEGVRCLLQQGLASVTDVNDEGRTPLDVAATWWQSEICGLLLNAAAEIKFELLSHSAYERRVMVHMFSQPRHRPSIEQIETIRTLLGQGREFFYDIEIDQLLRSDIFALLHGPEDTYWWLFQHYLPELQLDTVIYDNQWWSDQLKEYVIRFPHSDRLPDLLNHCTTLAIQRAVLRLVERFSFLFWHGFPSLKSFQLMLDKIGTFSYSIILEEGVTPESPLSIALRSSLSFSRFQTLLVQLNINIVRLVDDEINHGSCKLLGWTTDSLNTLFQTSIHIDKNAYERKDCSNCLMDAYLIRESHIIWEQQLDQIKAGSDIVIDLQGIGLPCIGEWQIFRHFFNETPLCFFCLANSACSYKFDFTCQKCMHSCFRNFNTKHMVHFEGNTCENRATPHVSGIIENSEDNIQTPEMDTQIAEISGEEANTTTNSDMVDNILDISKEAEDIWYDCVESNEN